MRKFIIYISITAIIALNLALIPSAAAIGASPMRTILQAAPGETVTGTIMTYNSAEEGDPILANGIIGDFIVDETEQVRLLNSPDEDNPQSLMNWMEMTINNIETAPKESATLEYTITVPKDAKSQSYYGTVFVTDQSANTNNGGMNIRTGVIHLVLLEVTGSLHSALELKSFELAQDEQKTYFKTVFYNEGNTHQAPKATLVMMDTNRDILDDYILNSDLNNALPNRTKTFTTTWIPAEYEDGIYYVALNGEDNNSNKLTGEIKLEIKDGKAQMLSDTNENSGMQILQTIGIIIAIAAAMIIANFATIKLRKRRKKHTYKKHLTILLLFGFNLLIPQANAQSDTGFTGLMEVDEPSAVIINLVGCWEEVTLNADDWGWNDRDEDVDLLEPSDREPGAGGDQYGFYDIIGGFPNGPLFTFSQYAFGYNDCKFQITASGWTSWDISLFGAPFEHTTDPGNYIDDMDNYKGSDYDFILDNEDPDPTGDPNDQYSPIAAEHGFFILATSDPINLDPAQDTQSLESGSVAYTIPKNYDDTNCTAGGDRPCYHYIPNELSTAQVIFDDIATDLTAETFNIRFGAGAYLTALSGDYTQGIFLSVVGTP